MKTRAKINAYILRNAAVAVFFSVLLIAFSWAFNSPNNWNESDGAIGGSDTAAKIASQSRAFSFAERVAYQRAIEDVYWRHRIWPKENPDSKPSLDAVMSQEQLESKVTRYLRDSLMLEDHWQKPITAEQLQAEIDRMARDTKQPQVLRELFEALGNDAAVIAECLARPMLAERLIADLSLQSGTQRFDFPRRDGLDSISAATSTRQFAYILPAIALAGDPPCTVNTWTAMSTTNAPSSRKGHTAVWTGTEMIVWGGDDGTNVSHPVNTGGRYNPATDSWIATDTSGAPEPRFKHTAVWTGTEMIVWGGGYYPLNNGGRYNPGTNSWTGTSTTNAPEERFRSAAVWTGTEMIVWGGYDVDFEGHFVPLDTGGKYNPNTNSWTATTTINAPFARADHTAVWTGSEMVVWGNSDIGYNSGTGGRYNPSADSWIATSTTNAPHPRGFTAVWTGSKMIVWGNNGYNSSTGGSYSPDSDSWTATSLTNAPSGRTRHTAVWTGSEMIVWGGVLQDDQTVLNSGGRYNPNTDTWRATSITHAPAARYNHTAVWTGSEMIVWGGLGGCCQPPILFNSGGRYCAQSGPTPTPTPTPTPNCSPAVSYDFNGDCHPDYVLYKASTQQTTLWYLNNNVYVNGRYGPTVPSGSALVTVGDFNGDAKPDYVLYNATTRQTAIWYMNNNLHIGSAEGPTLNARWNLVGAADFNRDGHPDYLLFDPTTHATLIYYLNNNVGLYWRSGPTLNARWSLVGAADFNSDGHPDYLLFDPTTRATLIYYMNNNVGLWWRSGPTLTNGWSLVAP